jgi:copper chaperone PCu(A)C
VTGRRISRRYSRPGRRRIRLAATTLLSGLAALTVLAACGSGQYAQTANQVPGVPGANVNAGPNGAIQLRNIVVQYNGPAGYPVGGSAPLVVRIFNAGQNPVALTGADAAGTATTVLLVGPEPSVPAPTSTPTASGSPTATPGASASPTPAVTPGSASYSIRIPPVGYATLVPGQGSYLLLAGLTKAIMPGDNVPVTFHFADGTSVTVQVPVDLPGAPASRGNPVSGEDNPGG